MIQIYHNPRCGKSRNCILFLKDSDQEFEIINYLETPPSFEELKALLQKLNLSPIELVRQKEKIWIETFKGKLLTPDEVIRAMVENPILIERPIVVNGNKASIGRDLDKIKAII
ncbi:arsenate reductase (glutaredoxin) [Flavobacterium sp. N3904]|uniref:arsenate reductase (glutaredoxin) n=1 Tax=Flavobacterium sp. N3904 TaxID=2986835 RepID=UPI0022249383|nr:arsenate reductase (glutaredoxin) [Flavobacterium sp. N3904]